VFLRTESFYTLIAAPKAVCFAQRRTTDVGVILFSAQEKSEDAAKYLCVCTLVELTLPKCLSGRQREVDKRADHINNGQIYGLLTRRVRSAAHEKEKQN
jgi:hypothetical protein